MPLFILLVLSRAKLLEKRALLVVRFLALGRRVELVGVTALTLTDWSTAATHRVEDFLLAAQ